MPLTFEQFKQLRAKGLSIEQINKFEAGEKPQQSKPLLPQPKEQGVSGMAGVQLGVAKGAVSTLTGASSLGERLIKGIGRFGTKLLTPKDKEDELVRKLGFEKTDKTSAETIIPEDVRTAKGTAEKIGFGIEQFAEYLVPGSASLKAGKAVSAGVKGGKIAKGLVRLGTTGLVEGVLGTGQAGLQSGKIGKEEAGVGVASLVAPTALAGAGKVIKTLTPQPIKAVIKEAVDKALRPSKKSIVDPKFYDKADDAMHILARNKSIVDEATGELRNPKNRGEMLTVLKNAKKKIYNDYSSLAEIATGKGVAVNTAPIISDTINIVKNKGWSSDVKKYALKQSRSLADLEGATPAKIQDRIEELNNNFNPFATGKDKVKTEIDASISRRLRESLDEAIEKTEGAGYQQLRNEYASLKAIENDLLNASAVEARRNKGSLIDFTDIFTTGNITASVFTGNPAMLAQGLGGRGVKEYLKWINDPNRYLRKAFEAIESNPNFRSPLGSPTQKLLPRGTTKTPIVEQAINLPARSQSTIDVQELNRVIQQTDKKRLVEALNNLDEVELKKLLTEGTGGALGEPIRLPDKADRIGVKEIFKSPAVGKTATKTDPLIQEAKKYKSAEEFVKAKEKDIVYHGSKVPLKKFDNKRGGVFFTDNYADATGFGSPDNVYEGFLNFKKPLVIDAKGAKWDKLNTKFGKSTQEVVGNAEKAGYDGVTFKNIVDNIGDTENWGGTGTIHYAIKPKDAFINESQLTDIWNKANK